MDDADGLFVFGSKAGLRFEPLRKITPRRVEVPAAQRMGFIGENVFAADIAKIFPFEWGGPTGGDVTKPFVDGIADGHQPMTPGPDALVVTRVINAAYKSANEHRSVSVE